MTKKLASAFSFMPKKGNLIRSLSIDISHLSSRFDRARAIGWPYQIRADSTHDSLVYSACFCRLRCRVRFHAPLLASTQVDNGEERSTARLWYLLISLRIKYSHRRENTFIFTAAGPGSQSLYLIVVYILGYVT